MILVSIIVRCDRRLILFLAAAGRLVLGCRDFCQTLAGFVALIAFRVSVFLAFSISPSERLLLSR